MKTPPCPYDHSDCPLPADCERLRAERDQERVEKLTEQLKSAAAGTENLMPLFIECVESNLTLGEITGALREVWGEYQPPSW